MWPLTSLVISEFIASFYYINTQHNLRLPYGGIFGGAAALTKQQFLKMNGFSNDYWGWGGKLLLVFFVECHNLIMLGEDDDLSARVTYAGFKISRYPIKIARYKMIRHKHENDSNPVNK